MGLLLFFSKLGEFVAYNPFIQHKTYLKTTDNALTFVSIRLAIQTDSCTFAA